MSFIHPVRVKHEGVPRYAERRALCRSRVFGRQRVMSVHCHEHAANNGRRHRLDPQ